MKRQQQDQDGKIFRAAFGGTPAGHTALMRLLELGFYFEQVVDPGEQQVKNFVTLILNKMEVLTNKEDRAIIIKEGLKMAFEREING